MSAFGGKADMTLCGNPLLRSLLGVKRTWPFAPHMSAYDPKRTLHSHSSAVPISKLVTHAAEERVLARCPANIGRFESRTTLDVSHTVIRRSGIHPERPGETVC